MQDLFCNKSLLIPEREETCNLKPTTSKLQKGTCGSITSWPLPIPSNTRLSLIYLRKLRFQLFCLIHQTTRRIAHLIPSIGWMFQLRLCFLRQCSAREDVALGGIVQCAFLRHLRVQVHRQSCRNFLYISSSELPCKKLVHFSAE